MTQLNYDLKMREALAGQRADGENGDALSYTNPALAQINTLTFGGTTTDGVYSVTVTFNQSSLNQQPTRSFDQVFSITRAGGLPATDANLATALAAQVNAQTSMIKAVAVGDDCILNFVNPGLNHGIATADPAPGTLVNVLTQPTGGMNVRVGTFVRQATVITADNNRTLVPIVLGTTIANVVGIAERSGYNLFQDAPSPFALTGSFGFDLFRTGDEISVGNRGRWYVEVFEAVNPNSVPIMWMNPGTSAQLGMLGAGSPGGDRLDVSSICRFDSVTTGPGLAKVQLFRT